MVAGFNIPELAGEELVLDYETIAAIYLGTVQCPVCADSSLCTNRSSSANSSTSYAGNISTWDDQRIKDLNTEIANLLPSEPITVITQNVSSTLTQLFVSVLRSNVPEFAAQVGSSTNPTFPVQSTNRSLVTTDADGVMPLLASKSYSMAFWQHYDILLVSSLSLLLLPTTLVRGGAHSLTHPPH
jgi:ABC-type phosphate transport system substrate-binding protein